MLNKEDLYRRMIKKVDYKCIKNKVRGQNIHEHLIRIYAVLNNLEKESLLIDHYLCRHCFNYRADYIVSSDTAVKKLCKKCLAEVENDSVCIRKEVCEPIYNYEIYKLLLFKNLLIDDIYYYIGSFYIEQLCN